MSYLYLIRHGFTPANNASFNKQTQLYTIASNREMPLDIEYGIEQAKELAKFLSNFKGKSLILYSPYRRVKETLSYTLKELKLDYDLEECEELVEINSGVHYAKTEEELISMYPDAKNVLYNLKIDKLNTKYLNGESQNDVKERLKDISIRIKNILDSSKYENIFIFAHGTVNKWLCYLLTGSYFTEPQKNCEVIKLNSNSYESIFVPKLYVPLGYKVDILKHKNALNNNIML